MRQWEGSVWRETERAAAAASLNRIGWHQSSGYSSFLSTFVLTKKRLNDKREIDAATATTEATTGAAVASLWPLQESRSLSFHRLNSSSKLPPLASRKMGALG